MCRFITITNLVKKQFHVLLSRLVRGGLDIAMFSSLSFGQKEKNSPFAVFGCVLLFSDSAHSGWITGLTGRVY